MKNKNFLDKFFENKTKKDVLYIHIITIFLLGFIIYYFIYPLASSFKTKEEKNHQNNVQTLNHLKIQKNVYITQIANLRKTIKKLELSKNSLHKQKTFFDDLISLLDFAEFNKYKWAEYVRNIVYDAKNEGLKLMNFANSLYKDTKHSYINKKMDIIVNVKGEYKNLIYYIYKYENTKELLRVNELNATDKGEYMIKYTLYGYGK
ncbi:hypothetical protein [Lebetimonas sp. JH292]|uniref:hypothetical protein n=1 Tax=Lebetimonas sp. JH292 TaxID=990068 RepID=UPI0004671E6E|nr:hypothetical protein [Lebetimonas sp. JH292]